MSDRRRDPPEVNAVGDLVLTDPEAMRVLAEPARLDLLDRVRREGPSTAAGLSTQQVSTEEVESHLEALEEAGFVTRTGAMGESRWTAIGKGFVFEIPDDPKGQDAARRLTRVMMTRYVDLPARWIEDDEPRLEVEWARAAGLFNAGVTVTPDELRRLQEGLEELLAPFITRDTIPGDARRTRLLAFFLPEAEK